MSLPVTPWYECELRESWRSYTYPSGVKVEIEDPTKLRHVDSDSFEGVEITNRRGARFYVAAGWHFCVAIPKEVS